MMRMRLLVVIDEDFHCCILVTALCFACYDTYTIFCQLDLERCGFVLQSVDNHMALWSSSMIPRLGHPNIEEVLGSTPSEALFFCRPLHTGNVS